MTPFSRDPESPTPAIHPPDPAPDPEPDPEPEPEPAPALLRKSALARVFAYLVQDDPMTAGRLLIQLLPAQAAVWSRPIAYDLVLGEFACVRVTSANGTVDVDFADGPRELREVSFQISGDLASIARALAAGRFRRRFGREMATVRGKRSKSAALVRLTRARLSLAQLYSAGVRLEAPLALKVVSLIVRPELTRGERFTIAHQEPGARLADCYMYIRDGSPLGVTLIEPLDPPATTVVCPGATLLPILGGATVEGMFVRGEPRSLELVQGWIAEAEGS
jgi:hypothetical protein